MNKKIFCVVVTFNRLDCLKRNLECLVSQTEKIDKIVVVDNASSDGTKEYMEQFASENEVIEYCRLNENTGGSGGFSYGVEKAYQMGADYIWGMDDDAYPESDALKELLNAKKKIATEAALWSNCDKSCEKNIARVKTWMFVGFFISREIIDKVGLPRNDYFIYWDDHEYAQRIIKGGFKIYKVKKSIINHQDANKVYYPDKKIGFISMKMYKMADWKVYYYVRNKIFAYKWNDINKYEAIIDGLKTLIKSYIFKTKQGRIVRKALFDGITGKAGRQVEP